MSNFNPLYADELSQLLLSGANPYFGTRNTETPRMDQALPQLTPEEQYAIDDAARRESLGEPPALLARPVEQQTPLMTDEEYYNSGYEPQQSGNYGAVPEMLLAENIIQAGEEKKNLDKAYEQQVNALDAYSQSLKSQLNTQEQADEQRKAYLDSLKKVDEDRNLIMQGLNNLKPQKDSPGVIFGKALAMALGAFGASMTGSPNYAMQIINEGADRAARELASNRENAYKLLGFNKEQREELNSRFKTQQELQGIIKSSLLQANIERAKVSVDQAKSGKELADSRLKLALLTDEQRKLDKQLIAKYAIAQMKQGNQDRGLAPTNASTIDNQTFRMLTPKQQEDIIRADKTLTDFNSTYSDMNQLISSYSNLSDFDKKASIERFKRSLGLLIKEAEELGVPNANDAMFMELQKDPIGLFTSGRGMAELKTLVYDTMKRAKNIFSTYKIPLNKGYDLRINQLRKDIGLKDN